MSDRFSKLFALPENLYSVGSPVVISAGALLKDNQTGKVLVQLKIKNISTKIIKALKVLIVPLDTTNSPLGEPFEYQYLDLDIHRDVEFGQKVPIALPDSHSRGFSVSVNQVIFTDNSIWNAENPTWEPLNEPEAIEAHIADTELVKQFKIQYGNECLYMLSEQKDIWICLCGALNHSDEATCHKCHKGVSDFKNINWNALKEEADKRVAAEKAKAEKETEYKKQREIQKQKQNRKIICSVVLIVALCFLATVILKNLQYTSEIVRCKEMINEHAFSNEYANYIIYFEDENTCIIKNFITDTEMESNYIFTNNYGSMEVNDSTKRYCEIKIDSPDSPYQKFKVVYSASNNSFEESQVYLETIVKPNNKRIFNINTEMTQLMK